MNTEHPIIEEQIAEDLMRVFDSIKDEDIYLSENTRKKLYSSIVAYLSNLNIASMMRDSYSAVNAYKANMLKSYADGVDSLGVRFPNGLYTKTKTGDFVGANIAIKKFLIELLEVNNNFPH